MDSLLRPVQTQVRAPDGGREVVDTRYNAAGLPVLSDEYHVAAKQDPVPVLVQPASRAGIPRSHRYAYDFAGRQISDSLYSGEVLKWATTTAYGGDRVSVTPPAGGTPTTTVTDVRGRTTQLIQHLGATTAATGATTSYVYDLAGNLVKMTDPKGNVWSYTYDLQGNQLTSKDPDKGASSATYDVAGQLVSSTDARGVTIKHVYDGLGRETSTTTASGAVLTSTVWDTVQKGQVSSRTRFSNGGQFTDRVDAYDVAGRVTKSSTVIPAVTGLVDAKLAGTYTTSTTYNPDGSVASQVLPAAGPLPAETLAFGYDGLGQPSTLKGTIGTTTTSYVSATSYLVAGLPSGYTVGPVGGRSQT
ncbi:MAG: hypothetical protein FWC46_08755, partial [Actinomycetia bacterium]|nr:hypothetical protein [Actinomycetes bacterium]